MNTFFKHYQIAGSFPHHKFFKNREFFGIDFHIDSYIDFLWKIDPK